MELVTIAALADNRVIGKDGELPWPSIPADKRQYRRRIADHPVILGRRTFESMRDDLPGSAQIVVSRSRRDYEDDTVFGATDVAEAIELAESVGSDRAFVIGGAAIYELFLPHVDRLILSRIPGEYDGDVRFPEWDPTDWHLVEETDYSSFTLQQWVRNED